MKAADSQTTEETMAEETPVTIELPSGRSVATAEPATGEPAAASNSGPVEVDLAMLEATLDYIRPALQADGGDLVLLGVENGVVNLQMVGACGGCPLSMMTLKAGIERILTDRVPGVREVHAI